MAFPCGDCGKNCLKSVVACESFDQWFHIRCQKISKAQFGIISNSPSCDYFCSGCTNKDNNFDYDLALDRLGKYGQSGVLSEGVSVEKILLRKTDKTVLSDRTDFTFSAGNVIKDRISSSLLESLGTSLPGKSPISVSGDGNCLFNAISLALCGDEGLASEQRVKTCIELVEKSKKQ